MDGHQTTKTMKKIFQIFNICCLLCFITSATSCSSSSNNSSLSLDKDASITSFSIGDIDGEIDQINEIITVHMPADTNVGALVPQAVLSPGATCTMLQGQSINFKLPVTFTIKNGDVFRKYTVHIELDNASILSFKIDKYEGAIDNRFHTITVYVPLEYDITNLTPVITISEGANVTPLSGLSQDFTHPVNYRVVYRSADVTYTVTVIPANMKIPAFLGNAPTIDELTNPEEKAAAQWFMQNISAAEYLSMSDVVAGNVSFKKYNTIWYHWHIDWFNDSNVVYPDDLQQVMSQLQNFYQDGGNLLLTRYAVCLLSDLGITLNGQRPNNGWGGAEDQPEIVTGPWDFQAYDNQKYHDVFHNISLDGNKMYTFDTGYGVTNSTYQWHIGSDWGGYDNIDMWETKTGGIPLAHGGDGAVVMAEFAFNNGSGKVITISSGAYDWWCPNMSDTDQYHSNIYTLTKNAIQYLNQ